MEPAIERYIVEVYQPTRAKLIHEFSNSACHLGQEAQCAVSYLVDDFSRHRSNKRSILIYIGWLLGGGENNSAIPSICAVALEFAHHAGLIHDDISDESSRRNFRSSVWVEFSNLPAKKDGVTLTGPTFGKNIAMWLGILVATWAQNWFALALVQIPMDTANRAREVWTQLFTDTWASQHINLVLTHTQDDASDDRLYQAQKLISLKSKYVASGPLELGYRFAGGHSELIESLLRFSDPLGKAYVLLNDLEGVFGNPEKMDSLPEDLKERRLSILVEMARRGASAEQSRLLERVGSADLSESEVIAIKDIIVQSGSKSGVERQINSLKEEAVHALGSQLIKPSVKPILLDILNKALSVYQT